MKELPFTTRARIIKETLFEEAKKPNQPPVTTKEVLIELISSKDPVLNLILKKFKIDTDALLSRLSKTQPMNEMLEPGVNFNMTVEARRVFDFANEEAVTTNISTIGSEHILLGLMRENQGTASKLLKDFGLNVDAVRDEILNIFKTNTIQSEPITLLDPFQLKFLKTSIEQFSTRNIPESRRKEFSLTYSTSGWIATIFWDRLLVKDSKEWVHKPMARLEFNPMLEKWRIYWPNKSNGQWILHSADYSTSVTQLLEVIMNDPEGLFDKPSILE